MIFFVVVVAILLLYLYIGITSPSSSLAAWLPCSLHNTSELDSTGLLYRMDLSPLILSEKTAKSTSNPIKCDLHLLDLDNFLPFLPSSSTLFPLLKCGNTKHTLPPLHRVVRSTHIHIHRSSDPSIRTHSWSPAIIIPRTVAVVAHHVPSVVVVVGRGHGRAARTAHAQSPQPAAVRRGCLRDGRIHLITVVLENVPEPAPVLLRHGDRGAEVRLDLADAHVDPAVVLSNVKVKVLVLRPHVPPLGQLPAPGHSVGALQATQPAAVGRAKLLQQIRQRVPELDHALRRDGDLGPGAAARDGLGDAQEAAAHILLQVEVVPAVVLDHHLRLELAVVGQVVRVRGAQARVEVAERGQVVAELGGRGQGQEHLAATTIGTDLGEGEMEEEQRRNGGSVDSFCI